MCGGSIKLKEHPMTTTTLQLKLERGRFAEHVKASLARLVPSPWRLALRATPKAPAMSAADAVSREAQEVREMAHSYSKTDPGFAADLYAAAARHERIYGG
jgi:hypothetical protein